MDIEKSTPASRLVNKHGRLLLSRFGLTFLLIAFRVELILIVPFPCKSIVLLCGGNEPMQALFTFSSMTK